MQIKRLRMWCTIILKVAKIKPIRAVFQNKPAISTIVDGAIAAVQEVDAVETIEVTDSEDLDAVVVLGAAEGTKVLTIETNAAAVMEVARTIETNAVVTAAAVDRLIETNAAPALEVVVIVVAENTAVEAAADIEEVSVDHHAVPEVIVLEDADAVVLAVLVVVVMLRTTVTPSSTVVKRSHRVDAASSDLFAENDLFMLCYDDDVDLFFATI